MSVDIEGTLAGLAFGSAFTLSGACLLFVILGYTAYAEMAAKILLGMLAVGAILFGSLFLIVVPILELYKLITGETI